MGSTKPPIADGDFYLRMIVACVDQEERGMIEILNLTGMNVSSLCLLRPEDLTRNQAGCRLHWTNPKTKTRYSISVPDDRLMPIVDFLRSRRKTRQQYHSLTRKIGRKAGYRNVSPMTFRYNLIIKLLIDGRSLAEVREATGCSAQLTMRLYIQVQDEKIARMGEKQPTHSARGCLSILSRLRWD